MPEPQQGTGTPLDAAAQKAQHQAATARPLAVVHLTLLTDGKMSIQHSGNIAACVGAMEMAKLIILGKKPGDDGGPSKIIRL